VRPILRSHHAFAWTAAFCAFAVAAPAAANDTPKSVLDRFRAKIDAALPGRKIRDVDIGIAVQSLGNGDWLYEKEADTKLIPASVSKVFTAYTALKKLKPTAVFTTRVYVTGSLKDGILTGDVYLRGGGDPSLTSERMWMLVNELKRSGITAITGNLVADSTYFDEEKNPSSRPKYLRDQAYNAPVGALSFNFNTTTIFVRPSDVPGQRPVVFTDPENSYIDVVNQATTGDAGSVNTLNVSRTNFVEGDLGDTVLLKGSIPADTKELRFYRNIVNPALYTLHMFKTFWEARGLKFSGNTKEGTVPVGARLILEFESMPLWHIVWGMNKFSNNFVAEQILKKVGAEVHGAPGSIEKGLMTMREVLAEIGIRPGDYTISDGSGLTRETRVTARQVVKVLRAAYRDFGMMPEFVASFGIAGEDGTLRNRMPTEELQGLLRAKTGSIDGVASLAGFVPAESGELLAFAILINDKRMKLGRLTPWVDRIAKAVQGFVRR
jgi:D-alanyl-D-alanine carboxypeptidase/D-alanyl-D-alanine-endopeptidase (penicillin-binding protein 4)